jgi:hypothetical protein
VRGVFHCLAQSGQPALLRIAERFVGACHRCVLMRDFGSCPATSFIMFTVVLS